MNELNSLLAEGKLEKAKEIINQSQQEQPIKFFNLSLVEFKQENFAKSFYYLEKAQSQGLISKEVFDAKSKLIAKLGTKSIINSYSLKSSVFLYAYGYDANIFITTVILITFLATVLIRKTKYLIGGGVLIPAVLIGSFYFNLKSLNGGVTVDAQPIYRGPSRIFEQVSILPSGIKVLYEENGKDWKYIKYPESLKGWIYKGKVFNL